MERFSGVAGDLFSIIYFSKSGSRSHRLPTQRMLLYKLIHSSSQAIVSQPLKAYVEVTSVYNVSPHPPGQWSISMNKLLPPLRQTLPYLTRAAIDPLWLCALSYLFPYQAATSTAALAVPFINPSQLSDHLYYSGVSCPMSRGNPGWLLQHSSSLRFQATCFDTSRVFCFCVCQTLFKEILNLSPWTTVFFLYHSPFFYRE